jgi:quinohemoprotein ethanol dehydrogenase
MLSAWDPVTQKERWFAPGGGSNGGGALATAGNLVFQALNDGGRLVAYSADKGEKLHEIVTGQTSGMGPPMTYMLDGKQYVAVMGGQGTVVGGFAPPGAPAPPPPATPPAPAISPRLYVYALDAKAP